MCCQPLCFFDVKKRPLVMGILNVTPDSFYDGGRYADRDKALARAMEMANEGADIIDIGGESTRPGAEAVSAQEEVDRVCPVVEAVTRETELPVSVDTTKSSVARQAAAAGASIINDISGGCFDPDILNVAADTGCNVILSHTSGLPKNMQERTHYESLLEEICGFLSQAAKKAEACGISKEKIILDPGIGFGKGLEDNYRLIRHIPEIKKIGFPVLIGLSRKSLIGNLYWDTRADRLPATIALNSAALLLGADIIRVHDVRPHVLALAAVLKLVGAH